MNYAAWLQRKLDDPNTSTADYRKYWQEMQDLQFQQRVVTQAALKRQSRNVPVGV